MNPETEWEEISKQTKAELIAKKQLENEFEQRKMKQNND